MTPASPLAPHTSPTTPHHICAGRHAANTWPLAHSSRHSCISPLLCYISSPQTVKPCCAIFLPWGSSLLAGPHYPENRFPVLCLIAAPRFFSPCCAILSWGSFPLAVPYCCPENCLPLLCHITALMITLRIIPPLLCPIAIPWTVNSLLCHISSPQTVSTCCDILLPWGSSHIAVP